ncbi:MAG TPA: TIGR03936 family radical SAM-associated protein [Acidimicrobiales bacterium]|nr:TIGR03936 family radical SAM-associated protein [Acidimicrobiales bacterium]
MRLRFRFAKAGKVRWTSHRDVARMWERALRRVRVPVAYSGGFSPRPKLSFGLALPTGAESVAEYLDVELDGAADPAELAPLLSAALPVGVDVLGGVGDEGGSSLQNDVTACRWEIEIDGDLAPAVEAMLAADSVVITRQRKGQDVTDDIRPAIIRLEFADGVLAAELATQPRGLRPSELLAGLGFEPENARVRRTHQWIERDGARWEPIPLDATDAPLAFGRAS